MYRQLGCHAVIWDTHDARMTSLQLFDFYIHDKNEVRYFKHP